MKDISPFEYWQKNTIDEAFLQCDQLSPPLPINYSGEKASNNKNAMQILLAIYCKFYDLIAQH